MMAKNGFWSGFGLGALTGIATGAAAFVAVSSRTASYDSRILRLERSIQIGRPVEEVFAEWSNLESLPKKISAIRRVNVSGRNSNWTLDIDGRPFQFTAETEQLIPNQAIGWKSLSGPKHSGRINFARLANDTLVHVTMNYAPPLGRFGRLLAPISDHLESQIEQALRDFKRALEGTPERRSISGSPRNAGTAGERRGNRGPASAGWNEPSSEQATGTHGRARNPQGTPGTHVEDDRGSVQMPGAVDYTRPPKDRS
jgi:uncharacterized membrane protein